MTEPLVTAVCCTYGRVNRLENALAQFLAQDYPNKRLTIFNSFPRQTLVFEHPQVEVYNCQWRPASMGECRNAAIDAGAAGIVVTFDDDDHYRSSHLSTIAKHFTDGVQWVWLDSMFFTEKGKISRIITGSPNVFAFTTDAWFKAKGYDPVNTGEDRGFIAKVNGMKGVRVKLEPEELTFAYGWDTGDFHLSGHGFDEPGKVSGYQKVLADVESLANCGKIPTGVIELKPRLQFDADKEMANWLASNHFLRAENNNEVCIVELGRLGDIINILPVALHIHNTFETPYMMVSREFATVLDGVSYVKPYITNLKSDQVNAAISIASRRFKHVLVTQVWGQDWEVEKQCSAFNQESWRLAGFAHKFESLEWRPVFDKRNPARERALIDRAERSGKPLLLLNVTKSISSPFERGEELHKIIVNKLRDRFEIVDLAPFVVPRIYDIVGLMEQASVMCSIDTVHLHLAAATNIPVVAIRNGKPWLGTMSRGPDVSDFTYSDVMKRTEQLCNTIVDAAQITRWNGPINQPRPAPIRRLIHVVEMHKESEKREIKRKRAAQATWDTLYCESGVIPVHYYDYKRKATSIGDARELPFLKDCLRAAMDVALPDDIIFFTNDDIWLHPDIAGLLRFQTSVYGACCGQRVDFSKPIPSKYSPEQLTKMGHKHFGRDLFSFTKEWLERKWDEIGDYILGASDWDLALCAMIRKEQGLLTTKRLFKDVIFPSEIPLGYVCHCVHPAKWTHPHNIDTAPSQKHNRKLFRKWGEQHCPTLKFVPGDVI